MKFHYTASNISGRIVEGEMDAENSDEVLSFLAGKSLRPISLRSFKEGEGVNTRSIFGQTINVADKIFLTKYLALMLRAGTDLFRAIDVLIRDLEKPVLKAFLIEIRTSLEKGQSFYSTFAKYPQYFSSVFVNLVRAGEASGNLESVFMTLSISLEKEQDIRNKVQAALVYPLILLGLSMLILVLLISFALPKIATVFQGTGYEPPIFSRIVFAIGLFLNKYIFLLLPVGVLLIFLFWLIFFRLDPKKRILSRFLYKAPVISKVLKEIALQRFASTLASLIKAGMPILDSLEITADAVGSEALKQSLQRIAREGITKGLTVGEAFRREPEFPMVVSNLISVSEKAGHTEDILKTLADFYESEIDTSVKTLVSFVEPVLLLFIGVMIGGIALAIIVPIYQLVGAV